MTILAGWIDVETLPSDTDAASSAMLAAVEREGRAASILVHEPRLTVIGSAADSTVRAGGITVAFDGRPRWTGHESNVESIAAFARAYEMSGMEALAELDGSFAIVLHDTERNHSLLAVDRIGTRPLAYTVMPGGGLIFGSSVSAIIAHPMVDARPSLQSVYQYLHFHVIPSPDAIYERIYKLEPATCLFYVGGRVDTRIYWTPCFDPVDRSRLGELQEELRSLLRISIGRCASSRRTASFLSGGVDSSTVTGVLREVRGQRTSAYTIGFDVSGYDEMRYAEAVTNHFDINLHSSYVTPADVARAIPLIGESYDEPFGNSSAVAVQYCAQLAKHDDIEILLAGDGGDELFAGNKRYLEQQLFELYFRIPRLIRELALDPLAGSDLLALVPGARKLRRYVRLALTPMPTRLDAYNMLAGDAKSGILEPAFADSVDLGRPHALMSARYDLPTGEALLSRMLFFDWKFTLADNDLRKVNRMCELNGIEARYPLLSNALVDLSTRVPVHYLIRHQRLRFFFKDALRDFLPKTTLHKSKHGFGLPFGQWLNESAELQAIVYPLLNSLGRRRLIKQEFLDRVVKACRQDHPAYYGGVIWPYMMLEQWLQSHSIDLRL